MRRRSEVEEEKEERPQQEVVIPVDPVNEQIVIAASAVDAETREKLVGFLRPDHFLVEKHRPIWTAFIEIVHRKLTYDPAILTRLGGEDVDIEYLEQILELRPEVPDNLDFHVDALMWDRQRATAATGPVASLIEALKNPRESPERLRALARHAAEVLEGHGAGRYLHDPKELVREAMRDLDERIAGRAVYPYGIDGLDYYEEANDEAEPERRMLPGAAPGMITVVTGVSGGGKTTLTANLTLALARQRRRILYGAWEMKGRLTLELLACISAGYSRKDLQQGRITVEQREVLRQRMEAIGEYVVFMQNPFRRRRGEKMTNEKNLDVVQEHIMASGCEIFVADLWKRCLRHTQPDDEEEALLRQQAMAEETGVHCILLQQQRLKDIEMRPDKRPTREGIKGSAAWVEVADTILAPHRPALWKRVPDNRLEVFVLKQRYGLWPLGIEFEWNGDKGSIEGGHAIEYDQPGETEETSSAFRSPATRKKGRR